jgi:hypothetical protein
MRNCWEPESRAEHSTCSTNRGPDELAARQHGAFPKVGVANVRMAVVRLPFYERVSWWDTQLLLLSKHFCRIYNKRSTTSRPEMGVICACDSQGDQAESGVQWKRWLRQHLSFVASFQL